MLMTASPTADAERYFDAREAKESALDARVKFAYGPGYVPEFVEKALKAAPFATLQKICAASDELQPSYLDGRNDQTLKAAGSALMDWLQEFAYDCAAQDLTIK